MTFFSENENLEIGENYTRGEICNYMNIKYNSDDIERGIFKPGRFQSMLLFSTLKNRMGYLNGRISDTEFIFSGDSFYLDCDIRNHKLMNKELLLFIREDTETGFYYFGPCEFTNELKLPNSKYPLYLLKLKDTKFSKNKAINIPVINT